MTLDSVVLAAIPGLIGVYHGVMQRSKVEQIKAKLRLRYGPNYTPIPALNWLSTKALAPEKRLIIERKELPSVAMAFLGGLLNLCFAGAVLAFSWPLYAKALAVEPLGVFHGAGLVLTAYLGMFAIGYLAFTAYLADLVLTLLRSWPHLRAKAA